MQDQSLVDWCECLKGEWLYNIYSGYIWSHMLLRVTNMKTKKDGREGVNYSPRPLL